MSDVREYIQALKASARLGRLVVHHQVLDEAAPEYGDCRRSWPVSMERILAGTGVDRLYSHQARAVDLIRAGRHVVAATPTASGKTLIYNLPFMERVLADPEARALYMFPLKALAQDQLKVFQAMAGNAPPGRMPTAAIYDGDTTPWFRRKIRDNPPNALLTNPEMVHLSMLPYHDKWVPFWAGLELVVVDEVHTYRGVMGSHMAQVFRRLIRVCRRYNKDGPTFAFLSATVGNPGELAHALTGLNPEVVTDSGAPVGRRNFVFVNPAETMQLSPSSAAIDLLKAALARGLRTIVYTRSRRMAELISLWVRDKAGTYRDRISAYRAGFLPEERRDIEARMASGELLAVVSTSALELGIDIGGLDLCILVGYPGTIMSTLQRGGRVGRSGRESAVVLVAGEDALDQYFMRHPDDFFQRPPEKAMLNPYNPVIMERHLDCAAAEMAFNRDKPEDAAWLDREPVARTVADMIGKGRLLEDEDERHIYSRRKRPHREVDLRGAGKSMPIMALETGDDGAQMVNVGGIDRLRAVKETHPGAVYLHLGKTYVVKDLDLDAGQVTVKRARVNYFTRVRSNKNTEILETTGVCAAWGARVFKGRLRVTETVTGYEKRRSSGGQLLTIVPLDLPPQTFETEGLWIEVPRRIQRMAEDELVHFMGGIHAVEHAAIGIMPLLVMTDRNDLGGISTDFHPQVGAAAVFVYDGTPGGVGLTAQAFGQAEELLDRTLAAIASCPCELGCPSCVHSPKCGSGNRPIDKAASMFVLRALRDAPGPELPVLEDSITEPLAKSNTNSFQNSHVVVSSSSHGAQDGPKANHSPEISNTNQEQTMTNKADKIRYAVLDVETRRSAQEVGGWNKAHKMGVSIAVIYDSTTDEFIAYTQDELAAMAKRLEQMDLVVGFNSSRFDYQVLSGCLDYPFADLPTLDMLVKVHQRLGYRLSLDSLARATLNAPKSADGLQALEWWKQGRLDEITKYCTQDVKITRDLYRFGRDNHHLLFTNKAKKTVRLPVDW